MKFIVFIAFLTLVSSTASSRSYPSSFEFGSYDDSSAAIFRKLDEAKSYVEVAEAVPELHSVPEYSTIIRFLEEGKRYINTAYLITHEGYSLTSVKSFILQTKLAREAFYNAYQAAEELGLSDVGQQALYAVEAVRAAFFYAEQVITSYYPSSYVRSLIPDYFSKGLYDYTSYSPFWRYSGSSSSYSNNYYHPSSYRYSGYSPYNSYSSYYPYSSFSKFGSFWPYSGYGSHSPKNSFYGPDSLYTYPSNSKYGSYWPYSSLYGSYGSSYGYDSTVVPYFYGLTGKSFI